MVQSTGIFSLRTTCPACRGEGKVIREPCGECRGSGFVVRAVSREVKIPPGVDSQTRLRIPGEGEPSPAGGPRGDCYCFITVQPDPLFQRHGRDLICQVPISYPQAALGATIQVPTLDGCEDLQIPRGTQSGEAFRLSGRGMPDMKHRRRGDLVVQVFIEVPKRLDAGARAAPAGVGGDGKQQRHARAQELLQQVEAVLSVRLAIKAE